MVRYVALLRGINVGTAKRIAMSDLRESFASLGYTGVRTVLQSGNVVFDSATPVDASRLEEHIERSTGVRAGVVVVDADRFRAIAAANPLLEIADDPARLLVTFLETVPDPAGLELPGDEELAPERLVFGEHAVYQWLPDGVLASKLPPRFAAALGPRVTARNWRTVQKILPLLED